MIDPPDPSNEEMPAGSDQQPATVVGEEDGEDLVLSFIPALVVLLTAAAREKGSPLTRAEVESIRDGATCIAVRRSVHDAMAGERGYPDLDPEHAWEQWQQVRP